MKAAVGEKHTKSPVTGIKMPVCTFFHLCFFKEKVVAEIHDDSEDVFIVKSLAFILVFPIHPVTPMASYW